MRQARPAGCHPAALHPRRGTGGVRAAKRSARRHAAPGAVRAGHTGKHYADYLRTGVCIGAWQQGRLGAYLILRLCGQSNENYAAFLGVPQAQWQHWANADSAVVHPDWRGNGLQRAMLQAALPLLPPQITHLGATVSPDNSYSLRNAQAGGFVIRCRREMYGGYDRYLLEKQL